MGDAVFRLPFRARLLGFESDTRRLADAGWRFQVETSAMGFGFATRVSLIASNTNRMYMAGDAVISDRQLVIMKPHEQLAYLTEGVSFDFKVISEHVQLNVAGKMGANFYTEIEPFSTYEMHNDRVMLRQLFTPTADVQEHEIIITPDRVPSILEAILKAQEPKQKEIRAAARKAEGRKVEHARISSLREVA